MTMLPSNKSLLPSYLDGSNVDRHCNMVDNACKDVHDLMEWVGTFFSLVRPIVFGSNSILLNSNSPILEIKVKNNGSYIHTISFDESEMITEYTLDLIPSENMTVIMNNSDNVTYKRQYGTPDEYLENIGSLFGLPMKTDETDTDYINRLQYFISHYGSDDLALLMLRLLYGVTEHSMYSTTSGLHQYIIRRWDRTNYDEIQKFSDKYCPITRPLMVVPPIQLEEYTSTSFTFHDWIPVSELSSATIKFYNINKNKTETPAYDNDHTLSISTTSITDGTGYPVSSYLYMSLNNSAYLLCFKVYDSTSIAYSEFYYRSAQEKFQEAEGYRGRGQQLPNSWFKADFLTNIVVTGSSSVEYGSDVVLTAQVLDGLGQPVNTGTLIWYIDGDDPDGVDISGEPVTVTFSGQSIGSHEYEFEYDPGSSSYHASNTIYDVTVTKKSSNISGTESVVLTIGDSTTVSGTVSVAGTGTSGLTVKLLDYDDTVLSTTTTTSGGAFSFTYAPQSVSASGHNLKLVYDGSSTVQSSTKSIPVTINRQASSITTSVDSISTTYGSSTSITGTLSIGGTGQSGITVKLLDYDDTVLSSTSTGTGGSFTFNYTANNMQTSGHSIKVSYEGSSTVEASSKSIPVTINRQSSSITTSVDSITTAYGQTTSITGTFKVGTTGTSGATLKLLDYDDTVLDSTTTSTGGSFTFNYTANNMSTSGHNIRVVYDGSSTVEASSKSIAVTIKQSSSISTDTDQIQVTYGSSTSITGTLTIAGTGTSGQTVKLLDIDGSTVLSSTTTTTGGEFTFTYNGTSMSANNQYLTVQYVETSTTIGSTKQVQVKMKKQVSTMTVTSGAGANVYYGTSTTINGTLTVGGTGASGQTVYLRSGNTNIASTTTTTGGSFTFNYVPQSWSESGNQVVTFDATSTVASSYAEVNITFKRHESEIVLSSNTLTLYYGSSGTISGTFKVDNTGTSGETLKLVDVNNNTLATTTTGTGGSFSFNYTANDWSLSGTNLRVQYDQTDYNSGTYENVALTLQRHTTTLSVADVTGSVGDTVDIVVNAVDENGDPVTEGTVSVEVTQQSNS